MGAGLRPNRVAELSDTPPPPPQENLPEPSTYALMGAGLAALGVARKRLAR